LAPIDGACRIFGPIAAELPKGFAGADAAAAVNALHHGCGDAFGFDKQRRQRRRQLLGVALQ
jgi:hypothetical protein